jgi:hypothetical protein
VGSLACLLVYFFLSIFPHFFHRFFPQGESRICGDSLAPFFFYFIVSSFWEVGSRGCETLVYVLVSFPFHPSLIPSVDYFTASSPGRFLPHFWHLPACSFSLFIAFFRRVERGVGVLATRDRRASSVFLLPFISSLVFSSKILFLASLLCFSFDVIAGAAEPATALRNLKRFHGDIHDVRSML